MQKNECAKAWKQVTKIYDETIDQNDPRITAKRIADELGMNTAKEVFAVVSKIKQHDGRIYGRNREAMNAIPVNEDCVACDTDNPMFYAGLDHIHTAHINQIITELLKVDGQQLGH